MYGYVPFGQAPFGYAANSGVAPPTPTVTSISVTPTSVTQASGRIQFAVNVNGTNSPSQATTAAVSGPGSINSANLYTVPAQTSAVQTATITWTSVQDTSKSVSAVVTIPAAGAITFLPEFYRSIIMRASLSDPTAAMTATEVYNLGDSSSLRIFLTRPDASYAALAPVLLNAPLQTVDQGTFAAYQYSVYNFLPSDITMAGVYKMRHVYIDGNGSIVSSTSSFTVTQQ